MDSGAAGHGGQTVGGSREDVHEPTRGRPAAPEDGSPGREEGPRLGPLALTALVVGSMVGAGIFSIPQNMAAGPAAPGALLVGWAVTAVGMLALARTFQFLGQHAEHPADGLHGYARDGFGPLPGFLAAWGYWISAWLGNLAYLVLIFSTLGLFVPAFGDGTNWVSVAAGSVLLWLYVGLLLRGVREASGVNLLVTVAKLVPLLIFVVVVALAFDPGVFAADLWGEEEGLGPVFDQVRAMMLVTVWAFLGIEGASVYARRARDRRDVGRATVSGLVLVLALLVSVNLLSVGILTRAELADLQDPALAGILEAVVGPWGAGLVSVGLLVSVGGAMLAWMLLCAEILASTARAGAMPRAFGREPRPGVPRTAVLLTGFVVQAGLVWAHFQGAAYYDVILMAGSMMLVPYLLAAGYAVRLALGGRGGGWLAVLTTALASGYAVWLLYAGGLGYLLMTAVFYLAGLGVHVWSRREQGRPGLDGVREQGLALVVVVGAVVAGHGFVTGWLVV